VHCRRSPSFAAAGFAHRAAVRFSGAYDFFARLDPTIHVSSFHVLRAPESDDGDFAAVNHIPKSRVRHAEPARLRFH
jgi:hypothetical protein